MDLEKLLADCMDAVLLGDTPRTVELVNQGINAGVDPLVLITDGMIKAMDEVGLRFSRGEYYVPEMLMSAKAMQKGMDLLKPLLIGDKAMEPVGKIVIGTVKGDLHDIGKNLVAIMSEGAGFEVYDLGRDTKPEKFVEKVKEIKPDFMGMSALLTTTMPNMHVTIKALQAAGIRDQVNVIVGGAPVTQEWADKITADAYSPDAASAVKRMKSMMGIAVEA